MAKEDYKIGDIVYSTSGYNRTDVSFYIVVARTEKTLTIQPIESKVVDGDPMRTYYVIPDESKRDSNQFRVRINKFGTACIKGYSRWDDEYLNVWDGNPVWANTGYAL